MRKNKELLLKKRNASTDNVGESVLGRSPVIVTSSISYKSSSNAIINIRS